MDAANIRDYELDRLVDSHIELCELFDGARVSGRREAPLLITMTEGKAWADCLADLVDRALVVYGGPGFVQDTAIFALKAALVQAIASRLD
jgi:hypothetical protein